jgi:PhnB protein
MDRSDQALARPNKTIQGDFMSVKPIPEGASRLVPHLVCDGAAEAIEFYKKAFDAVEVMRMPSPDGKIMHAQLKIHGETLYLCDPMQGKDPKALGGSPVTMSLWSEDADASFNKAVEAGATVTMPLDDMFWGDRYGRLVDPFGHHWAIMMQKENLTPEQIGERAQAAFAQA